MSFPLAPRGQGLSGHPHKGLLVLRAPQPPPWEPTPAAPRCPRLSRAPPGGGAGPGRAGSAVRVKAAPGGRRAAGGPARGGGRGAPEAAGG